MKKLLLLFCLAFTVQQLSALTVSIMPTNISCYAACDGALMANVTGGQAPYTYYWTPVNISGPTISGLCSGTYVVTVTDALSATASATITLIDPPAVVVTITPSSPSTCANTSITLSASGATTYSWFPGNLTGASIVVTPAVTTTYTCTGTNASGCTATATVTVYVNQPPVVSFSSTTNVSCFGGSDGSVTCTPSGGNPPYAYIWTPQSSTAQTMTNLIAGTYTCTVTDANGCIGANTTIITQPPQLVATITNITPSGCNFCDGSATVSGTGGTGAYTYSWIPAGNTPTIQLICAGSYTAEITDANGCIASAPALVGDSCDYVWPGDANDDAVADNIDILDIGIANGATGTTRANASLNWIGQPSAAWGQTLASGTDYKWVDCNGDGAINPADTNAVVQNFGLTHNNRYSANPPYNASLPDLTVSMGQQQLPANAAGTLTISLGNSSVAAANVYGVAFTLNFDPAQIDATSFRMNENGSWMGTAGNDLMGVTLIPGANAGSVQVALTRLDHNDMSGSGLIANMGFMTTNALYASGTSQNVNFTISNITVISSNETPQQVNAVGDSVNVIDPLILNVNETAHANSISVYPNPFSESTQIVLPENCSGKNCELVLTDATGRVVLVQQTNGSGIITLQRGTIEAGVYFCTLRSEGVLLTTEKLLIR